MRRLAFIAALVFAVTALGDLPGSPFGGAGSGAVTIAGTQTITGAKTFSTVITSTIGSGSPAITLNTDGARLCFNAACSTRISGDGGGGLAMTTTNGISTASNITANALIGQNNNSVVLQAANTNAGIQVTGALLFGVGTLGSSSNQSAIGTFSKNMTVVGNAADTTEDNLMTSALPASALNVDGRGIRVTAWGDGVSTADVTTVKCYFGATAVVTKVLTASQANTWRAVFEVLRTAATTQTASGTLWNGGTANSTAQTNAAPGETLANSITVKCTGQRATTSTANSVRELGMIVEVMN